MYGQTTVGLYNGYKLSSTISTLRIGTMHAQQIDRQSVPRNHISYCIYGQEYGIHLNSHTQIPLCNNMTQKCLKKSGDEQADPMHFILLTLSGVQELKV